MLAARASARTFTLRSAVIRIAGKSPPKPPPQRLHRLDAVAAVEVVIDQQAVRRRPGLAEHRQRALAVRRRNDFAAPAAQQGHHAIKDLGVVIDTNRDGAGELAGIGGGLRRDEAGRCRRGHRNRD